jgi:hypothetical protein
MTSHYLLDDCIYHILKCLQNYHSTLFNCLLVNRFWCKATVPLLYANPFIIRKRKIIKTLIPCFSETEILQLKSIIGININDKHKSLFEYPKYLKTYNYFDVDHTINEWIYSISNLFQKYLSERIELIKIFHQLILYHSINIKKFIIDSNLSINSNFNFNSLISKLTKLNSLKLKLHNTGREIEKEFLNNIAIHCLNLKELEICSEAVLHAALRVKVRADIIEKLCTIIQRQNNLNKFKIREYFLDDNIFLSLESQKHSLVSIEFLYIVFSNISFKNLISFYNLNHLIFCGCKDDISTLGRYEILRLASFKLKTLKFIRNTWNKNIEPTIIKYLGISLQYLSINEDIITFPMIENFSIHCLNLITLEITTNFINIDLSVFSYFKNLKIRKLNINITCERGMSEIFKSLANNLSINVKEISFMIYACTIYEQSYFKILLENCHNYLKKINLSKLLIGSEFFKIILNYIKKSNNSLEILSLARTGKILNNEELKLLDKIKDKGVRIVINS